MRLKRASVSHGQLYYRKAKRLIPGGTQLLSKRPEMFLPEHWPAYYDRAKGCEVEDLEGRRYIDMSYMGIGSCVLGYADPDVNSAVIEVVGRGSMSTLNAPEEVDFAESFLRLHKWAARIRYARTGGEAMAIAVRIARAAARKDVVLFCGYHGWHDWYLAANLASCRALDGHLLPGLSPRGVPRRLKETALPFKYNEVADFLGLVKKYDGRVAAIVMEPVRSQEPSAAFLRAVQDTARRKKIVLIVDEITAGFRLNAGGAHLHYGLEPDIAVFAKGMSNGFPMAAIIGKERVMRSAQETFISSTYWTDRVGPTAALATLNKFRSERVEQHLIRVGEKVQAGWAKIAGHRGLDIRVYGIKPLGHFSFNHPDALALKTLFTQEMLKKGFLAINAFYASWAHRDRHVDRYLAAVDEGFALLAAAVSKNDIRRRLDGPVCHAGFKRIA